MPSILNATTVNGIAVSGDNSGVLALQTNNGTTAVTIDTSQNVGIGTTSPESIAGYSILQVGGSTSTKGVVQSSDGTVKVAMYLGADALARVGTRTNDPVLLITNATERMRITSGGNLLVGTTSSIAPAAGKIETTFTGGTNYGVAIKNLSTSTGSALIFIRDTGAGVGSIDLSTTGTSYNTTAAGQSTGAVLQSSGIAFPATQSASSDANTLDDYEEGTWTPSLAGNTTYVTRYGYYTKIGRLVTVQFEIHVSTLGTGNTLSFGGLPFASGGTGNGQGGSVGYFSNAANSIVFLTLRLDQNSTEIALASLTAAGVTLGTGLAFFGNNARLLGSMTYMA